MANKLIGRCSTSLIITHKETATRYHFTLRKAAAARASVRAARVRGAGHTACWWRCQWCSHLGNNSAQGCPDLAIPLPGAHPRELTQRSTQSFADVTAASFTVDKQCSNPMPICGQMNTWAMSTASGRTQLSTARVGPWRVRPRQLPAASGPQQSEGEGLGQEEVAATHPVLKAT